jgi:hypothetical protein
MSSSSLSFGNSLPSSAQFFVAPEVPTNQRGASVQYLAGVQVIGETVRQVEAPANETFGRSAPIKYGAKSGYAHIVYDRTAPSEPIIKLVQKVNGSFSYVYFKPNINAKLSTLAFQLLFNEAIFPLSSKVAVPAQSAPAATSSGSGSLGGALIRELLPEGFSSSATNRAPTPVVFKSDEDVKMVVQAYPKSGAALLLRVLDKVKNAAEDPRQSLFRTDLRALMGNPAIVKRWSESDGSRVSLQQVNGNLRVTVQLPVSNQTYVRDLPAPDGNPTWQPSGGLKFIKFGSDTNIQQAAKADPRSPAASMERALNILNAAADNKADTSMREVLRKIMAGQLSTFSWTGKDGSLVELTKQDGVLRVDVTPKGSKVSYYHRLNAPDGNPAWTPRPSSTTTLVPPKAGSVRVDRYPVIKPAILELMAQQKLWQPIGSLEVLVGGNAPATKIKVFKATVQGTDVYSVLKPKSAQGYYDASGQYVKTPDTYIPVAAVAAGTPYFVISAQVTDLVRGQFGDRRRLDKTPAPETGASARVGHTPGVEPSLWTDQEKTAFMMWMIRTMPVVSATGEWPVIFSKVMSDPALREEVASFYLTNPKGRLDQIASIKELASSGATKLDEAATVLSLFGFMKFKGAPNARVPKGKPFGPQQTLGQQVAGARLQAQAAWGRMVDGVRQGLSWGTIQKSFDGMVTNPLKKMFEAVSSKGWSPLKNVLPGIGAATKQLVGGAALAAWQGIKNPKALADLGWNAGKSAIAAALDPTKPIALQIPTLVKNFPQPQLTGNKETDDRLKVEREVKLTMAFSAILLRYFGQSIQSDSKGAVAQMFIGATGGGISAAVFAENKTPSEFLLYMTLGAFSSKNVSQQVFSAGKNATLARQPFRFGVPAFTNYVTIDYQLGKLGLTEITQVTMARMVASVGFNSLSQEVAALKNKGQLVIPNAAQVLASVTSGGLRASGYAAAFKNIPATYAGKIQPYVLPMLLSVISSAVIKNLFGTKKPEDLTPAELKKVETEVVKYVQNNASEIDVVVKNIAVATVAAAYEAKR